MHIRFEFRKCKGVGIPSFYTGTGDIEIPCTEQVVSGISNSVPMVSGIPSSDPLIKGIPKLDLMIPKSYSNSGIPASIPEVDQHCKNNSVCLSSGKCATAT